MPQPMVALPCGSRSMSSVRRLVAAREAARLTAVVVFPTPPFWFAMAITRFIAPKCSYVHRKKSPAALFRTPATFPAAKCGFCGLRGRVTTRGAGPPCNGPRSSLSRDETALRGVDALLRETVCHDVSGAALAAAALEDLGQALGDTMDLRVNLGF